MLSVKHSYLIILLLFCSCSSKLSKEVTTSAGSIERIDASIDELINEDATVEMITEGYHWTEGPVWVASQDMLLFSDVPENTVYKWTADKGAAVYLKPSGYTAAEPTQSKEPGANGLLINNDGKLVLCQHGDRRIAIMDADMANPSSNFTTLASLYDGKKLNSPNDVVMGSNGEFYFTDPPYGLPGRGDESDTTKQLPFQGVYKIAADGKVTLLVDSITRPNGIALTPDGKTLIVANSDSKKAIWYAFDLHEDDPLSNARIFYNATENAQTEMGLPDGFKIDKAGNMFASGPGGVWIFNKAGKIIGKINLNGPASNIALGDDDKTLYITNDSRVLRVMMRK